jgi:NAD(P)-dependent dehydrogenase (short-subunit alcohol dehydrogenase family)
MQGKTVLITGADGGIGSETTRGLAKKGATIVMACLDLNDARPVYEEIKHESGNENIELMQIDLASLSSVREFAKQFSQKYRHLDVLINNAGIFCWNREETQEGFERTIGVNLLGPFLLTHLLLPILTQTPGGRILNVASNAYFQGKIDLSDLHLKKKYKGVNAYNSSKLAVVFFTQKLAERLKGTDITVNVLHPGHAATNIWNMWPGKWYQALLFKILKKFMHPTVEAAQNSIYLASSDEVKGITGKYFDNRKTKEVADNAKDMQLQKGLWELSEKLTQNLQ